MHEDKNVFFEMEAGRSEQASPVSPIAGLQREELPFAVVPMPFTAFFPWPSSSACVWKHSCVGIGGTAGLKPPGTQESNFTNPARRREALMCWDWMYSLQLQPGQVRRDLGEHHN